MALPLSITLEEHFSSRVAQTSPNCANDKITSFRTHLLDVLRDYQKERIANMDSNGVQIQVLSHVPSEGMTSSEISACNDELAGEIQKAPTRFRGFAMLPMKDVDEAIAELTRVVKKPGFVGALIDNHYEGDFFDGTQWQPFWAAVADLQIPLYIHPAFPSKKMEEAMYSGGALQDDATAAFAIGAFSFGWHASTATTVLRLLASGVFDRHPSIRIVIGHCGELLPFMFDRIEKSTSRMFKVKRTFATVMRENIWVTTSGMFDVNALRFLLAVMPRDHILFSVDYPFSDNALGKAYLEAIKEAKLFGSADEKGLQQFAAGNAADLLFKGQERQDVDALLTSKR